MQTLKSHQIQSMVEGLERLNISLRDLARLNTHAHFITDPARVEVLTIKSTLLRASLGDVEVVPPVVRKTVPMVPARQSESVL